MLGPLEVRTDGDPGEFVEVAGARLRALLIMLALHPATNHPPSPTPRPPDRASNHTSHTNTNLRAELTSFVGRDAELRQVADLLGSYRLITLTAALGWYWFLRRMKVEGAELIGEALSTLGAAAAHPENLAVAYAMGFPAGRGHAPARHRPRLAGPGRRARRRNRRPGQPDHAAAPPDIG
jgi:hypothetical protein